jgi:hypothetical protein
LAPLAQYLDLLPGVFERSGKSSDFYHCAPLRPASQHDFISVRLELLVILFHRFDVAE